MPKIEQQMQVSGQFQTHMTHLRVFLEYCHVNLVSLNAYHFATFHLQWDGGKVN